MVDDQYLTAFADKLIPEAFQRRHSAYLVERMDDLPHGSDAFDRWVDEFVTASIVDRYPAGHRPVRTVIVEGSDHIRWRWDGDPCCPADWLVDRVRAEVEPIPDPWVFAIELPWPCPQFEVIDPRTRRRVELDEPLWLDTTWQPIWYAEARGRGAARTRAGVVTLDYDPVTDTDTEYGRAPLPLDAPIPKAFHRILYGHRARKAHPIRRR